MWRRAWAEAQLLGWLAVVLLVVLLMRPGEPARGIPEGHRPDCNACQIAAAQARGPS